MNPENFTFQMARRHFLSDKSDYYALTVVDDKNRGEAQHLAREFSQTKVEKSGLRGLEALAWSTDSVADILDYIRARVGRDTKGAWSSRQSGQQLAKTLEETLQKDANEFFQKHPEAANDTQKRLLHLDLCREFIKHLVAHFEFEKSGVKHD